MIPELIKQWDENKYKLEDYFRNTPQSKYKDYENIVRKIFELCITKAACDGDEVFNLEKMTVINDGSYSGCEIYIIPIDGFSPNLSEYVVTNTYYGSCSGCDTLLGISKYDSGIPNEKQVKKYMTVALHLVQKLKWLFEEEEEEDY